MKTNLCSVLSALTIAFALAACEDAAEIARKPALVGSIVQDSVQRCDTGADPKRYEEKLRYLLSRMWSVALDDVAASGITVCMDGRDKPGWRGTPDIYYPRERVVAVRDYGDQDLYEMASLATIRQLGGEAFLPENCHYAIPVKRGTKSWYMFWVADPPVMESIFADNPQLRTAPVKRPAPAPSA